MPVAPALFADVLDRLKAQTRAEHTAMEGALDLMRDDLSLADYRRLLERYFAFYAPVEARLAGVFYSAPLGGLDFEARRKLPLLRADLDALGGRAADTLAVCDALPPLHTPAQAVGCLYVLEGATLGAIVIDRHVEQKPGVTPATGGRFLNAHGENTDSMWHQFRDAIPAFSLHSDQQEMVGASALATFATLHHWCEKGAEQ